LGSLQHRDNTADGEDTENEGDHNHWESAIRAVGRQQQRQSYAYDISENGGEPDDTKRRCIVAKPKPSNDQGDHKRR
jgi:hypothetical protein